MGKLTISMTIFNSKLLVYQRVNMTLCVHWHSLVIGCLVAMAVSPSSGTCARRRHGENKVGMPGMGD